MGSTWALSQHLCKINVFQDRTICKVRKCKVLVLSLGKRDDKHKKAQHALLEDKKDKSKLKITL
jgi:hypothetical protein